MKINTLVYFACLTFLASTIYNNGLHANSKSTNYKRAYIALLKKYSVLQFNQKIATTIKNQRSKKPKEGFDLGAAGPTNFRDGIGRQTAGLMDCLKNSKNISINYINTRILNGDIDYTDLPKSVKKIIERRQLGAFCNVVILEDVVTNSNPNVAARDYYYKFIPESTIKIAYTMFETDGIPEEWVPIFNEYFDALAVPDDYLVNVYKKAGVKKPIFVLPLGIYIDNYLKYPIKKKKNKIFTFGCSGAFSERKNQVRVLEGFAAAFGNNKNVRLILHGRNKDAIYEKILKIIKDKKLKNVKMIDRSFSNKEYIKFMASLDCYVALSAGEGFSIPARESLALGIPAIVSNNTAQKTICKSGYVVSVKSDVKIPAYYQHLQRTIGNFFDCTTNDAKKAFLDMYKNYDKHLKKAHEGRKWVQKYLYKNLRPYYEAIVKPKKVVLSKHNKLKKNVLETSSKRLYQKYKKLPKLKTPKTRQVEKNTQAEIVIDKMNHTKTQACDADIIGGYRVMTGQPIVGSEFLRFQRMCKANNWSLENLCHHIMDVDQAQYNLKTPPINVVNNFPIKLLNNMTIYGFYTDLFISHSIAKTGFWKPELEKIIRLIVKPGDNVIDIGSYIGYFTAVMSEIVGKKGRVFSIEALKPACNLIKESKKKNKWSNVEVIQQLLSQNNKKAWFLGKSINPGGSCIIPEAEAKEKESLLYMWTIHSKAKKLDVLMSNKKLTHLDYIKLDACGSEHLVLNGSMELIEKFKPTITMEFTPERYRNVGVNPIEILEKLEKLGYKFGFIKELSISENIKNSLKKKSYKPKQLVEIIEKDGNGHQDILMMRIK